MERLEKSDLRKWKKILMRWLKECNFDKQNYLTIEQSNIEEFFHEFCQHHNSLKEREEDILDFLKRNYADFEPILNDDHKVLNTIDYVYVYSLLLHYSCVKAPEIYYHELTKRLQPHDQTAITKFFEKLLEVSTYTKNTLRCIIAEVAKVHQSPTVPADGSGNISFSMQSSLRSSSSESPLRTPRSRGSNSSQLSQSPATPKTCMIKERTREIFNLRTDLETERFEKTALEHTLKKLQGSLEAKTAECNKYRELLRDLENRMADAQNLTEEQSTRKENMLKNRLCVEIAKKDKEISELTCSIHQTNEEQAQNTAKIKFLEKQLGMSSSYVQELNEMISELLQDVKEKEATIKHLTEDKMDLECFISEMRSNSENTRHPNFSCSSDYFQTTENSDVINENLGSKVIDIQLREKEQENLQLRDEIQQMQSDLHELIEGLQKLSMQTAQEFHLSLEEVDENDTKKTLLVFSECVGALSKSLKDEKQIVEQLKDHNLQLEQEKQNLMREYQEAESNLDLLKNEMEELLKSYNKLGVENEAVKGKLLASENETQVLAENNTTLIEKLKKLAFDFEEHRNQSTAKIKEFEEQINHLLGENNFYAKENSSLEKKIARQDMECVELKTMVKDWNEKYQSSRENYEMQIKSLNEKTKALEGQLDDCYKAEKMVKEQYEALLIKYEDMETYSREVNTYIEEMTKELNQKNDEMITLGKRLDETQKQNQKSEEEIEKLMTKLNRANEIIKEQEDVTKQQKKALKLVEALRVELKNKNAEIEVSEESLYALNNKISKIFHELNIPIAEGDAESQLGEIENKLNELTVKTNELKSIEDMLAEKTRQHEELLKNYKSKTKEYEEKLKKANLEELKTIEDMQKNYQTKRDEMMLSTKNICAEYEKALAHEDNLRKQEQDARLKIENELQLKTKSCALAEEKLRAKEVELKSLKSNFMTTQQSLDELEKQIKAIKEENALLKQEGVGKVEELSEKYEKFIAKEAIAQKIYEKTKQSLQEATEKIRELTEQLDEEKNKNIEFERKLTVANAENESEKETINLKSKELTELSEHHSDLKAKYELISNQISALKECKSDQLKLIENQLTKICKITEERDQIKHDFDDFAVKLQSENKALKENANCLNEAIEESNRKSRELQELCAEKDKVISDLKVELGERRNASSFEPLLAEKDEQIKHLHQQLQESETKLREMEATHQQNFDSWKSKLSELIQNLAEESRKLEEHDLKLEAVLKILQSNAMLYAEEKEKDGQEEEQTSSTSNSKCKLEQLQQLLSAVMLSLKNKHMRLEEIKQNNVVEDIIALNSDLAEQLKLQEEELNNLKQQNENLFILESNLKGEIMCQNDQIERKENQLKEKNKYAKELEKDLKDLKEQLLELQDHKAKYYIAMKEKSELESKLKESEVASDKLQAKVKGLECDLECLEKNMDLEVKQKKELQQKLDTMSEELKVKSNAIDNSLKQLKRLEEEANREAASKAIEFDTYTAKIYELESLQEALESELAVKDAEICAITEKYEQQSNVYENLRQEYENFLSSTENKQKEIEFFMKENAHLKDELDRANENVAELIHQISGVREEKNQVIAVMEMLRLEKDALSAQIEAQRKELEDSKQKLKAAILTEQKLERECVKAEKDLVALRSQFESSIESVSKLKNKNKEMAEQQTAMSQRLSQFALKLGDSQGDCANLQRENDKLAKLVESHNTNCEALKREKESLVLENKNLKQRLSKAEQEQQQFVEQLNAAAESQSKKIKETYELEFNEKLTKMEKALKSQTDKMSTLKTELRESEDVNVRLNHEIGALNTLIMSLKDALETQKSKENSLEEKEDVQQLKESKVQLEATAKELREQNAEINKQLEMYKKQNEEQAAQILELQHEVNHLEKLKSEAEDARAAWAEEVTQLQAELVKVKDENLELEQEIQKLTEKIDASESKYKALLTEKDELLIEMNAKSTEIDTLKKKLEDSRAASLMLSFQTPDKTLKEHGASDEIVKEVEMLRTRLTLTEEMLDKEHNVVAQLRMDNQILQAKYQAAKQRALEDTKYSEERIKENRLELEGKLEKMKNKMKSLYMDEVTKQKAKHDREIEKIKSESNVLREQNSKYEQHTRKLANQIVLLNENILEYRKENAILLAKIKNFENPLFKRPPTMATTYNLRSSTTSVPQLPPASGALCGGNLAMEDEEGEMFNNTYLADLKSGRMSDIIYKDVCAEELQYRNSLQPPHLKSSYAMQYDHNMAEDELKDGPFDDSMSALLSSTNNTTTGGARKKSIGTTLYKRPGPPTPGKHGGRFSLGGSSSPQREILKENYDSNNHSGVVSSTTIITSKTPARFSFFSSRFSMGNPKDEHEAEASNTPDDPQNEIKLAKRIVCTSTPRRGKMPSDQLLIRDRLAASKISEGDLNVRRSVSGTVTPVLTPDVSIIESPVASGAARVVIKTPNKLMPSLSAESSRRRSSKQSVRRESLRVTTTNKDINAPVDDNVSDGTSSSSCAPSSSGSHQNLRRSSRRFRNGRPSFPIAKYNNRNLSIWRERVRKRMQKQRFEEYNKQRMLDATAGNTTLSSTTLSARDSWMDKKTATNKGHSHKLEVQEQNVGEVVENGAGSSDEEEKFGVRIICDEDDIPRSSETLQAPQRILAGENEIDNEQIENNNVDTDTKVLTDDDVVAGDGAHFEQLLNIMNSNAPFKINASQFTDDTNPFGATATISAISVNSGASNASNPPAGSSSDVTKISNDKTNEILQHTQHSSSSRVIYGASVIVNHRLPNIATTSVRKSSIYFKKKNTLDKTKDKDNTVQPCGDDVLLVTDQTITIIDLLRMWHQMSGPARGFVGFAVITFIFLIGGILFRLFA